MSESDTPTGPEEHPGPSTRDVSEAAAWLNANLGRYTEAALVEELRSSGYTEDEIAAIRAEAARHAAARAVPEEPAARDLRAVAAIIVIVVFLGVWAILSLPRVLSTEDTYGFGELAAAILGTILAVIAVPTLFVIFDSDRLRRGTAGTLVAFLTIPFILLFVVAGMCVATTGGIR